MSGKGGGGEMEMQVSRYGMCSSANAGRNVDGWVGLGGYC